MSRWQRYADNQERRDVHCGSTSSPVGKGKFSFAMVSFVEEEARREAMGAMRDAAGRAVRRRAGANMVGV